MWEGTRSSFKRRLRYAEQHDWITEEWKRNQWRHRCQLFVWLPWNTCSTDRVAALNTAKIPPWISLLLCLQAAEAAHMHACMHACPAVNHCHAVVLKLSPCLVAVCELSLQMVSGWSQWLIWWLTGAPIKASGMLEPLGRNTKCIINSPKSRVFSAERLKQWYQGLPELEGELTFDTDHPHYCTRKGHSIV